MRLEGVIVHSSTHAARFEAIALESLAHRLADRSIRVNCVAPGPVWTPLIATGRIAEKVEGFGSKSLWGRPAQPAELAPFDVFLAAADSRYMSGEIVAPTVLPTTTN